MRCRVKERLRVSWESLVKLVRVESLEGSWGQLSYGSTGCRVNPYRIR